LTSNGANNVRPSWSHDLKWIYYGSHRTGRNQIWKVGVSGEPEIQVTKNGSGMTALVSADGREVYYLKEQGIWKVPVDGGNETKVVAPFCGNCLFTLSRHGIYFLDQCSAGRAPVFFDFATHSLKSLPNSISGCPLSVSPDEQWLLYTRGSGGSDLMLVENFR
jgi:hypothetical protein